MRIRAVFTSLLFLNIIGCSTIDSSESLNKTPQTFKCYQDVCFVNELSFINNTEQKVIAYMFNFMNGDEGFSFLDCQANTISTYSAECELNKYDEPECLYEFDDDTAPGAKYCKYLFN